MTKSKQSTRRSVLTAVSAAVLVSLLLIRIAEDFLPGRYWLGLLLSYVPPILFGLPPLVLLSIALLHRHRIASGLNLAAVFFALFGLLGFRFALHSHRTERTLLRVMTYNVEKWPQGAGAVAAVVDRVQPDIFCLQEAGDYPYVPGHQPLILQQRLSRYHFLRRGEIVIASLDPIILAVEAPLSPGPASRPALAAVIQTPYGSLTVLTAHLIPCEIDQHLTDGTLSLYSRQFVQARASQDNALLACADRLPPPLVVCGDFNAQPLTHSCRRLTRRYPDAFDLAGRGFGYTLPASLPMMRVDHLLLGKDVTAQQVWVPAVQASDHRPLVADVLYGRYGRDQ